MSSAFRTSIGGLLTPSGAYSASTFALNQSNDKEAFVFKAQEAISIARAGFNATAKNGTGVTWKISLQGVDATNGNPDGTIKGGGSPVSKTFTNSSVSIGTAPGDFNWFTFDNPYTCARGEDLAIVIEPSSGTPGSGTDDLTIGYQGGWTTSWGGPYVAQTDAGVTTKPSTGLPTFGYGTSSIAYGNPIKEALAQSFSSSSSPKVYGLKFTVPTTWWSTFRVVGARVMFSTPGATNAFELRLYEHGNGTALQTKAVDEDIVQAAGPRNYNIFFSDSSLATLNAGTAYYLMIAPTTTGNISLRGLTQASVDDWAPWPFGTNASLASFDGTSTFTPITTSRPFMEAILEDITAPLSGGGFVPSMQGQTGIGVF